jgi:hypothetical protein
MTTSRHKVLGIALMAVLAMMAFGAASAQALTQGIFLLDGKAAVKGGTVTGKFESKIGNILHSTFGANNAKILLSCEELSGGGTVLNEKEVLAKLTFTKCKVEEPAGCTVTEPIVAEGIVLALLHTPTGHPEVLTYLLGHPHIAGGAFATLHFSGCILPEEVLIKGLPVFKDCQNTMLTDKETHLIEETNLKLSTEEGLKFGAKPASILGSALVSDVGHTWAAH